MLLMCVLPESISAICAKSRLFQRVIADLMQSDLLALDLSQVIPTLVLMSESVNAQLEQALESFTDARTAA